MKPIYLLDAYGSIYRSYYAFAGKPLKNPSGKNVSAVYGFFRSLFQVWDQYSPLFFAAVFDSKTPTFRHAMYKEYKATRQKTPEDLHEQIPLIEEILKSLKLPILQADGYEADDIIATVATQCKLQKRLCYIISSDKDLLQLVDEHVKILKPNKDQGFIELGANEIKAEWSIEAKNILDYLSLTGDSSDNVPGVPGVGDKTAIKLLTEFNTLDNIFDNIDKVKPESLNKKLIAGKDSAYMSKQLIKLDCNMALDITNLDELLVSNLDRENANNLFLKEGMVSLVKKSSKHNTNKQSDRDDLNKTLELETETNPITENNIDYTYQIVTNHKELESICKEAIDLGYFAFDSETDSVDEMTTLPVGFSISLSSKKNFYIPLKSPDSVVMDSEHAKIILASLFKHSDIIIIGQNIKFDIHVMENWGTPIYCIPWDTMVAAWLIDSDSDSLKLEMLGRQYLGFSGTSYNGIVQKGQVFSDVPIAQAAPYAAEDAYMALKLKTVLEEKLKSKNLFELFSNIEMPVLTLLAKMERQGIRLDAKALQKTGLEFEVELKQVEADIFNMVGHSFNLNSPKQLQEVLFVERKLATGKKIKTGYSTDISVLEELAQYDKVPERILRYRTLQKLKSGYVDALLALSEKSERIRTRFMQTGTATGRLSSREPNLQNIPVRDEEGRLIRKAFIAAENKVLISADYSQIELVILAHLSEDAELMKAFVDGVDVHKRTAALIFAKNESDISPSERRAAKTINFGVMYGMSAFRLARELGISRSEAQNFINAYFSRYQGVAKYMTKTTEEALRLGYVTTILGRQRIIHNIDSRNANERAAAERVAINTPIQGSAADIVKLAMLKVDAVIKKSFKQANILLQVHDELIIEADRSIADKLCIAIEKAMSQVIELSIPLRVSVEKAESWGDMH